MLVLSRRVDETIVLPSLGVTVRVARIDGKAVRIGVEAPSEVRVLRGELATAVPAPSAKSHDHALRNLLSRATLSVHLAQHQCRAGLVDQAEQTLAAAIDHLRDLDRRYSPTKPTTPGPGCRTLIVEDDSNERELLAGILRMKGCTCATAADGIEALEYLASHERPDVVLLDMQMPRLDGPATLRQIRDDRRLDGLKVFSVSGSDPRDLGLRGGFDEWFSKPLDPARLWDAIVSTAPAN